MKATRLKLINFRCFRQLDITFDKSITVLVAPNAGGKSAVLDALRLSLHPFVSSFGDAICENSDSPRFTVQDIRQERCLNGSAMLTASHTSSLLYGNSGEETESELSSKTLSDWGKTYLTSMDDVTDKVTVLPVLLYLGTARGQLSFVDSAGHQGANGSSRLSGYDSCLSETASSSHFHHWIGHADKTNDELSTVRDSVNYLTEKQTGWCDIELIQGQHHQLFMSHPTRGKLPVHALGAGLQNVIYLAANIALRCAQLNPHFGSEAALKTPGIVMIDNLDMLLHPAAQQIIIPSLRKAFPLVQFVVTTNSPYLVGTVKRESVRVIQLDEDANGFAAIPFSETCGSVSDDVLLSVMNVNSQPNVPEAEGLHRLTTLVDQGKYRDPEALELMQKLKNSLGANHSQLQRLIRSIARQEVLNKFDSGC